MSPVIVLPVSKPDFHLALKLIRWMRLLKYSDCRYKLIVWVAASVPEANREQLEGAVYGMTDWHVEVNPTDYERPEFGYSAAANSMFLGALKFIQLIDPRPMLWLEADAIPTHPRWFEDVADEYAACGKPFLGDIHCDGIAHMTGIAVYPDDWMDVAPSIARVMDNPQQGWDSQCAAETYRQSHRSCRIQQVWMAPRFTVETLGFIHPETAIFHRSKDGTLIDALCARLGRPELPLTAPLSSRSPVHARYVPPPQPLPVPLVMRRARTTEIFIVTHARDMEFLRYCIRSIGKFSRGFSGTTLLVPRKEEGMYEWARGYTPTSIKYFDEVPGKGMLDHEVQICNADNWCDADQILHLDADCQLMRTMSPEFYAPGGKPIICREAYAVCGPRNENRLRWQECVFQALGVRPAHDMMCRHPQVHIRETYGLTRLAVEAHTGREFSNYVLSGPNIFPQNFCEFNTLAEVALREFPERYTVRDYDHAADILNFGLGTANFQYVYHKDRDAVREAWSHGGIETYRSSCEAILKEEGPAFYLK